MAGFFICLPSVAHFAKEGHSREGGNPAFYSGLFATSYLTQLWEWIAVFHLEKHGIATTLCVIYGKDGHIAVTFFAYLFRLAHVVANGYFRTEKTKN